ncbi:hypothetical protein KR009_002429 [Drosophila setifemur]|nr:hypothetical protein KR009_002429 [Drosophila setifemur]
MGRTLKSHDWVFWCGDFNYRIDMDKDELKECVRSGDLRTVLEFDQLRKEQEAGNVFGEFLEGEIGFDPTYKYDLFSDDYDTSEKQRAPAWTDRVLWRRRKALAEGDFAASAWNPGKLIHYGRSELKQSDHRPVIAIIDAEIMEIDQQRRRAVFEQVIRDLGPPDSTIVVHVLESTSGGEEEDGPTIYDENVMSALIAELAKMGEVTLVRYVEDTMWVTFRDGESALNAAAKRSIQVCGLDLVLELKSSDWQHLVDSEIELCTTNTIPLCAHPAEQAQMLQACTPEVPQRPKQPPTRPPARPPMPMSPKNSPRHLPHVGVISIVPKPAKPPMPPQPQSQQPLMPAPLQPQQAPPRPPAMDLTPTPSSKSQSPTELVSASSSASSSGKASPTAPSPSAGAAIQSCPPTPPRQMQSKQATPVSTPTRLAPTPKEQTPPGNDTAYETASNIYEEIQEDVPAPRHPPPAGPPPVMGAPMGPPPPLPNRRGPPPIPNRSGNAPPLPTRPANN